MPEALGGGASALRGWGRAGRELGVSEAYLDFLGWDGGSRGTELSEGHKDPLSDASSWPGC